MFKYYGSRRRLAARYPVPQFGVIIEPFAGSAAYSVHHRTSARRVILIEKDERVAALWHRLLAMDAPQIAALRCPAPGTRCDDLLVALAAGRSTGDTPESFLVTEWMALRFEPMVRRIASVVDECRHFEVWCADYRQAPRIEATWFVDPPYQPASGARPDRSRGGRYRHGSAGLDYGELGQWVDGLPGQVIACEQEGATWLGHDAQIPALSAGHTRYREIVVHRGPHAA